MKLDGKELRKLEVIIQTCSSVGIDSILIDEDTVRGVNEDKSCVIISKHEVPSLNGLKVGLSRIGVLLSRINLLKADPKVSVDAKENKDKKEISQLEISGSGAKTQFRCTSTALIKAPKAVNDLPHWRLTIPQGQIDLVINAIRTMGAKKVSVTSKDGKLVVVECVDTSQDAFSVELSTPLEKLSEDAINSFTHYYPTDVLLPVIKQNGDKDIDLTVGENGTLTSKVNGHSITIISQVEG